MILDMLTEQNFASVRTLSDQLNSSEATIRRDLAKLEDVGRLKRIRGGAQVLEMEKQTRRPSLQGTAFLAAKEKQASVKRRIAEKAVELCVDGESIIVNGGSSTYMMGEFLAQRRVSVLTNSYYLARDLIDNSDIQVTLPGGEVYRKQGIILSAFDNDTIQNYHGSKMFMGTPGIGDYGVMESDPLLIRAEQKLMKQADQLIILADSSKIGVRSNFIFEPLENVDILITDTHAEDRYIQLFEQHGINVIMVERENSLDKH
nr:DeoR/GlpR family DNA-binding transcription regulator [Aestuariicella hydrocarbonica]